MTWKRVTKKVMHFIKRATRKKAARSKKGRRPMNDMNKLFKSYGGYDGWLMYAETHYLPLLDRVGDALLDSNDKRLMAFLHDDIVQMIKNRG